MIVATAVPLALLCLIVVLGRNARRLAPLIIAALLWGFAITWPLVTVNSRWIQALGVTSLIVLGAPIIEEIGKALALPFVEISHRCSWFVDGAVLGLAAGTGFAIRENWVYLQGTGAEDGLGLAIARISSANLMHAGCTAIVGAALVATAGRRWFTRIPFALGALLVAMTLHSIFNRLTQHDGVSALVVTLVGLLVFAIAAALVALGIPLSARWVREDLKIAGATASEQAALVGGGKVDALLDQFEGRYGTQAAAKAEQLIKIQRTLAIGRHSGRADAAQLAALELQVNDLRRDIGLFAMMWLRSHLPVDDLAGGMWSHLDEGLSTVPTGAQVTGESPPPAASGLWARLGDVGGVADADGAQGVGPTEAGLDGRQV